MSMTTYEGEISMVGAGTWQDGAANGSGGGGQGKTILSVLEIGDHSLRKIVLPDYISNYIHPGKHTQILVGQGLSRGLITRPFIAAAKVDGKTYKESSGMVLFVSLAKSILYTIPVGIGLGAIWAPLGVLGVIGVFAYYIRDYLSFLRF
ncbi:hypothetical protein MTYP_00651 [Methylophilaceae bacterium]|nr:hypothetical protein MTYP_00651 [Methylophilaceae bacterium]